MSTLERRLGIPSAILIGLSSMIGAGVFYVWAPAAAVAGNGLFIGLFLAALVAALNALSTTQLAVAYPVSGGSYSYARETVGEWTGFAAGLLFLAGKTASVSAIALIVGNYLWAPQARLVAVVVLVVFAVVNMSGIRSTATVSAVIVTIVLAGLVLTLALAVSSAGGLSPVRLDVSAGWYGILQSAGLLFFCFAGYARMATLGEEVRDPRHTLPRAIFIALGITLLVYAAVAVVSVSLLGTGLLASTASPLAALASSAGLASSTGLLGGPGDIVIRGIAALACIGSLVGILAALSRTSLAMARNADLPGPLAFISPRTRAPIVAEGFVALAAIVAVLVLEPARLVGFSSCAVLCYYAIAHLSALRQPVAQRWLPRWIQVAGLLGCLLLAFTLPWQAVLGTAVVLGVGLAARVVVGRVLARAVARQVRR